MIRDTILFNEFGFGMDKDGLFTVMWAQDEEGVPTENYDKSFDSIEEARRYAEPHADNAFNEYLWVIEGDKVFLSTGIDNVIEKAPYVASVEWYRPCDCCASLAHYKPVKVAPTYNQRAKVQQLIDKVSAAA